MAATRPPRRTPWPELTSGVGGSGHAVAVVVANFNTRRLIGHLVFSLYRLLGRDQFVELVVVDNGSTDGSRALLSALQRASLLHLIQNRVQRYHGPALTHGISWLARGQRDGATAPVDYVWVLDSDAVVLRADTVRDALNIFHRLDAAAVGQKVGDPRYDELLTHNPEMLHPCSLMFDPRQLWRRPIPPFLEDGAPATAFQVAADARGVRLVHFPFIDDGYVLHLGRGTLHEIADAGDDRNRYYDWAVDHSEYHFSGREDGAARYRAFCDLFDEEVGELSPDNLVRACLAGARR